MRKILLCCVAAGLVLRLAAAFYYCPVEILGGGDDFVYHEAAKSIRTGRGFTFQNKPVSERGPVYPLFLAAAGGPETSACRLRYAQAAVSAAVVGLVWVVGNIAFGAPAGLWAAALLALNSEQILLSTSLYTECFYSFLLLLVALSFLRWMKKPDTVLLPAVSGAALALTALCRSFVLPFGAVMLAIAAYRLRDKRLLLRQVPAFLLAAGLVLSAWQVRNYSVFGRILPTETGLMGPVLYYASLGRINAPEDEDSEEPFKTVAATRPQLEWDRVMGGYALDNIAAHPLRYLASSLERGWHLWSETYTAYLLYYHPALRDFALRRWLAIRFAGDLCFAGLVLLAALGFWRERREPGAQFLAALALYFNLYAFFAVFVRFGAPAPPLISVLAGAGICSVLAALPARGKARGEEK
ncbi:MAG: hypothetical protein A2016_10260 [Elusimicrobia bacterium GWF2_62_30]|nr:MAG: hypothetical protein A2016_10260 [Elusimicrobia bacterium GWF2_62_30]